VQFSLKTIFGLLSNVPSTIVVLLAYVFVACFWIGAFTDSEAKRPFWRGAAIASIGFVLVFFLHMPDGPNNRTTLRPIIDFMIPDSTELISWHAFHIANVVEYWLIPVFGFLGGLLGKWFASRSDNTDR